jgi:membrane protein implicated in regulation of membrane protease activity
MMMLGRLLLFVLLTVSLGGCSGEMVMNYVIDHIPLWGWIVIFGVPSIIAMYYLSPILLPIWRMLPTPVKGVLIAVGAGVLAYLGGRYRGRANAEEQERQRNADALRKRTEVDREVGNLTGSEAQKRLRDRWGSDPS